MESLGIAIVPATFLAVTRRTLRAVVGTCAAQRLELFITLTVVDPGSRGCEILRLLADKGG